MTGGQGQNRTCNLVSFCESWAPSKENPSCVLRVWDMPWARSLSQLGPGAQNSWAVLTLGVESGWWAEGVQPRQGVCLVRGVFPAHSKVQHFSGFHPTRLPDPDQGQLGCSSSPSIFGRQLPGAPPTLVTGPEEETVRGLPKGGGIEGADYVSRPLPQRTSTCWWARGKHEMVECVRLSGCSADVRVCTPHTLLWGSGA